MAAAVVAAEDGKVVLQVPKTTLDVVVMVDKESAVLHIKLVNLLR